MEVTETEDIKRWQEYTEALYKKGLNDLDNYQSMFTHLECKVKCLRKHHYEQS